MTQDEIIAMARQAEFCVSPIDSVLLPKIEALIKLATAKERDRIANEARDIIRRAVVRGAVIEREACAKVCDAFQARDVGMQPAECAGAIRARGEQHG